MFDGSFRRRRPINLSGHRSTRSKTSLLESARQQRAERRLKQLHISSSISIQKVYRGWICRKKLATEVLPFETDSPLILSVRLSPPLIPFFSREDILKCLLGMNMNDISVLGAERVVHQALVHLVPPNSGTNEELSRLLQCLSPKICRMESILFHRLRDWIHSDPKSSITATLLQLSQRMESPLLGCALYTQTPPPHYSDPSSLLSCLSSSLYQSEVEEMVSGKELNLLQNTLDVLPVEGNADTIVKILNYGLIKKPELMILSGAAAANLNLDRLEVESMEIEEESESTDDDEDDATPSSSHLKRHPSTSSNDRSEYLTAHKLDKLFQSKIIQRRRDVALTPQLSHLANQIGASSLLYQLHTNTTSPVEYSSILCSILGGGSTGLNVTHCTSSPLLSHLAFRSSNDNNPLIEFLWKNRSIPQAAIAFCDIVSHSLLAMDDEEFRHVFSSSILQVRDIVLWLKQGLYELYWSNPLLVSQINSSNDDDDGEIKLRLFITGTKLYNAIHERYARLLRFHPFCQENDWYFPKLYLRNESDVVDNNTMSLEDENDEEEELANSFKDAKMARILTAIPQSISFEKRVNLFTSLLRADKKKNREERMDLSIWNLEDRGNMTLRIRRDVIYDDAMERFRDMDGRSLRKKVQITFVNKHGAEEAGIDGGGVFKEFLDDLIKEAFQPAKGLFEVTPLQTLHVGNGGLEQYEFLGKVLGKAVYESILVEPQFCLPFLNQLLGKQNSLDDVKNLDPELYRSLMKLKRMDETELDQLGMTFEYTPDKSNHQTIELVPGGSTTPVAKHNVIRFIHLLAHYKINLQSHSQTRAFLRGFRDLIPAHWLRLFSASELQKLISGDDTIKGINVTNLKNIMQYSGGYHPSQPMIQMFWEVVEEMTPEQQRQFLKFMTSCSRQPLLGFGALNPIPCLQQVRLTIEEEMAVRKGDVKGLKLPTSSTCMNLLKLPNYGDKKILKEKLLYAIEAGAGFELS